MAKIMEELKYTESHEWVRIEGNRAYIGITDYAQHAMGDIVFVELPELDVEVSAGGDFCVVESVKGANDVFAPVSGKVVEVNEDLEDAPQKVNEDPYGSWIAVVEMSDPTELDRLLDSDGYSGLTECAT